MLEKQGKTLYWLSRETNYDYTTLKKLCDGKSDSVRIKHIEAICRALNCNVSDIMEIEY